jgi:hypothetical protein
MGFPIMNAKQPFEQALAATPLFPESVAVTAFRKIRRRIIFKNIAGVGSACGVIAALVLFTGIMAPPSVTPAPSAEVVQELQYVHDCVWGADAETDVQYASAY